MTASRVTLGLALTLGGCTSITTLEAPVAIVTPDGHRGFSMSSVSTAFMSESDVRAELTQRFTAACGGPHKVLDEKFTPERNVMGTPFVRFHQVVECAQAAAPGA